MALHATGTITASNDTSVIDAPAAQTRIAICGLQIQLEGTTAVTVILKFGSVTKYRILLQSQGQGVLLPLPGNDRWVLEKGQGVTLNLSVASNVGYSIWYTTF